MTVETGIKVNLVPCHPGEFIRTELIEELGLDFAQIAEVLKVDQGEVSALLNCKVSLTPEMALRFEKGFGIGMEMMLRIQAWYDTEQMRDRADEVQVERYQPME